ncbi:MAG TPA: WbqC family protein [Methylophilaceae bacterium]|jgi:hypothetical protein
MTTICIHQPDFAPYLGFFHRLLLADHFIILDDAQFIKGGWQNRDRIKGKQGAAWLTLSIVKKFPQKINEVLLDPKVQWIDDNLNLLHDSYARASYFDEVFTRVEAIYRSGHQKMIELNLALMQLAFEYFDIEIPLSYASQHEVAGKSSARLVGLVKATGGDSYLTGTGSTDYLDETLFSEADIKVEWQQFRHPVYPQLHGDFEPMLSCLDVMFNCGKGAADVLRGTLTAK